MAALGTCERCGGLRWVPATDLPSETMPCPACQKDQAVAWMKRRHRADIIDPRSPLDRSRP